MEGQDPSQIRLTTYAWLRCQLVVMEELMPHGKTKTYAWKLPYLSW